MNQKNNKLSLFGILFFLAACQTTEVDLSSNLLLPERFNHIPMTQEQQNINQWWKNWQNPELSALIEEALQNNLDIAIAQARLQEALAISRLAEADLGPEVGLFANVGAGASDFDTGVYNPSGSSSYSGLLGVRASWELDFFGQKQSERDAATYSALAQQQTLYATRLLIASQVAENYMEIYAIDMQEALINQQLKSLADFRHYLLARFESGDVDAYNRDEIDKKISALNAKAATLDARRDTKERILAVLLGKMPQSFKIKRSLNPLEIIPKAPIGLQPSDLLMRRPDLMENAAVVNAYAAKYASAQADLYPRFELNFLGQGGRIELNNDLSYISGIGSFLGLGVQLPLFTNGRIQANIDAADARLQAALLDYDKTLLTALSEVESAYQMQGALEKQNQDLQRAVLQAKKQENSAKKLYNYGDRTFDETLNAQLEVLDYQLQWVDTRLNLALNLIQLYKALGGGWQIE